MDNARLDRSFGNQQITSAVQPSADIQHLPAEVMVQIAVHLRDMPSLCAFARICQYTARLSSEPAFIATMADAYTDAQCVALKDVEYDNRPAHLYQIACRFSSRMQETHLKQLMDCLDPQPGDEQSARGLRMGMANYVPMGTPMTKLASDLRRAAVAAPIWAGSLKGCDKGVLQYASQLMKEVSWTRDSKPIAVVFAKLDEERPLMMDSCLGIWKWVCSDEASMTQEQKHHVASCLLETIESLPMSEKIFLIDSIVNFGLLSSDPQQRSRLVIRIQKIVEYPETLDVALADKFCSILNKVLDELIDQKRILPGQHLLFAKKLPAQPWRENGKSIVIWLVKALQHNAGKMTAKQIAAAVPPGEDYEYQTRYLKLSEGRMTPAEIKAAIPRGIFSSKELAYLLASTSDGSFSWENFEKVDPEGAGKQEKCTIS